MEVFTKKFKNVEDRILKKKQGENNASFYIFEKYIILNMFMQKFSKKL